MVPEERPNFYAIDTKIRCARVFRFSPASDRKGRWEIARRARITTPSITTSRLLHLEDGREAPNADEVVELSRIFGIPPSMLTDSSVSVGTMLTWMERRTEAVIELMDPLEKEDPSGR